VNRAESSLGLASCCELDELLRRYPGLRIVPSESSLVKLVGILAFRATAPGRELIDDEYFVDLTVPNGFPDVPPCVREIAGRIPPSYHKLRDGSLCLASPTRLRMKLNGSHSILRFVERIVVPYFYSRSYFERHSVMPFGELDHGEAGILQDLAAIFGVEAGFVARGLVRLAAMKRAEANKQRCPCGSGRRLGRCHCRSVNALRWRLGRRWFRYLDQTLSVGERD
jgi:hypothetical protein